MTDQNPTGIETLFDPPPEAVIETHVSRVYLSGDRAWKLKQAVTLPYVDFGSLEQRRIACEREVALNRRTAPDLYLGCRAVYRDPAGHLSFHAQGAPVEWLVEMRRFDPQATFDALVRQRRLTPDQVERLADVIAGFHAGAAHVEADAGAMVERTVQLNRQAFDRLPPEALPAAALAEFHEVLAAEVARRRDSLAQRRFVGRMRHAHGDLHLRNIALIGGEPVLFDCLEFDDGLAEIDTLYDFAFLLMDLLQQGRTDFASLALNRYLESSADYAGLDLLPLYVALRAAIRCHIAAMKPESRAEAAQYLALASRALQSAGARLVAVGGLSGTGKTTVARRLASGLNGYPWGAVILRSDVLRKQLLGVPLTQPLPRESYTPESSRHTYAALLNRAALLLREGNSVVLDAVFGRADERGAAAAMAERCGVGFAGLWLTAPVDMLARRVTGRQGDASDATEAVVRWQTQALQPPTEMESAWTPVDAGGDRDATVARAEEALSGG
jgi:aminoglycoside phosphotransferase family enzyme/predicted kinase